jgi:DUF2075 family protein/predicted GIY-YIG superfamily endonuclease
MSQIEIIKYDFDESVKSELSDNQKVKNLWPIVYIINDKDIKEAYVGETTDGLSRMSNHLKNDKKNKLTELRLISCSLFNKSATLDIESNLIKYMHGDGSYNLLNANVGIANHSYYQKEEVYWDIFKDIWTALKSEGLVKKNIDEIDNSDLFKYSPYKSLSYDQLESIKKIMSALIDSDRKLIFVEGGAGSGKSILAIYLFKLLYTDISDLNELDFEDIYFIELLKEFKHKFKKPKVALVVPMSSFRNTLKKVFSNIKGLTNKMVIGPAEVANSNFDILIVDESHRLRRRVNLGAYFGSFDTAAQKMGFEKGESNELDWIVKQSNFQILFYDYGQSIKPSDIEKSKFDELKYNNQKNIAIHQLKSQFRVKGGLDYVAYLDNLLNCKLPESKSKIDIPGYEFLFFEDLGKMVSEIKIKNRKYGLCRILAGYSWKWISKGVENKFDIEIGDIKLKWNSVSDDWINTENSVNEVGCIHTTQGYDLNYTGIIFGNEIAYDKNKNEIIINKDNYHDKTGKNSISDPEILKTFIVNIYKTMMLRGIKGTYVYACNKDLSLYLKSCIKNY